MYIYIYAYDGQILYKLNSRFICDIKLHTFFLQEIDIKKQSVSTFAFCQYSDIRSVVRAMRQMDGEHLGANRIKLGFGKSMPTRCVWIDGVPENLSEQQLYEQFSRFGPVAHTIIDREKGHALIFYEAVSMMIYYFFLW